MTARVSNLTFDCNDALVVGTFWSQVIGQELDQGASSVYCSIGRSDSDRSKPAWFFEKVPELKTSKNRMHLDLIDSDASAVERLVTLGASIVAEHTVVGGNHHWTVMQDPEGNEFCISNSNYTG
jgi:predicted enzyme related to lactoylglutathione lyase